MTNEMLYEVIGNISDKHIKEAKQIGKTKQPLWCKWGALVACVCLVAGLAIPAVFHQPAEMPNEMLDSAVDLSALTIDGVNYLISPHLSVCDELPDGFIFGGEANVGGFEGCTYYINRNMPEWVYVYHEVLTDGTVDERGTLNRTEPHNAYVRYVDERLRGKDLICYNGSYYISMWSAEHLGNNPDVTREYFEEVNILYGKRIEGAVPDSFVLAGITEFTGKDTVPTGTLASNVKSAAVYYNPDDPTVIFAETHWFTATAEEKGETRHNGFNVYILYDCPFQPGI